MRPLISLPSAMVILEGASVKFCRFENLAEADHFAACVGNFDTDGGLAGQALDQHRFGLQTQAQIFRQRGDAAVFDARFGFVFEGGDDRAGVDLHHRTAHVELFELRFDSAGDFFQFLAVVAVTGRRLVQQIRRGQPVDSFAAGRGLRVGVTAKNGWLIDGLGRNIVQLIGQASNRNILLDFFGRLTRFGEILDRRGHVERRRVVDNGRRFRRNRPDRLPGTERCCICAARSALRRATRSAARALAASTARALRAARAARHFPTIACHLAIGPANQRINVATSKVVAK